MIIEQFHRKINQIIWPQKMSNQLRDQLIYISAFDINDIWVINLTHNWFLARFS